MLGSTSRFLAVSSAIAAAAVIDLPVAIRNTYSSVKFNVGTPPQAHYLLFDTGSASVWMVNTDCTLTSCLEYNGSSYKRQKYNSSASSSAVDLHSFSRVPYLGGNVAGEAFQDVFSTDDGAVEWNQTFLSANESSWRFITADGFLGLGFSSIAENATATLVETLLWDGKLSAPRFSLFYGTNLNDSGLQNGVLTIGGSHEDKYVDGSIVYAPLRKEPNYQLWRTALRSVNVLVARDPSNPNSTVEIRNGRLPTTSVPPGQFPKANTTWSSYGAGRAVFDTGAGRLSVPENIIEAMYYNLGWNYTALLKGQQRFGCQHMNASWAVTLTLGEGDEKDDVSFSMRGDEFLVPGQECMPPFDPSGAADFALVGGAFLRRHYSVFDFGGTKVEEYKPRIGFGRLKKEWDYYYQ